jgi:hypothetical protein
MINFQLFSLCGLLRSLIGWERRAESEAQQAPVDKEDRKEVADLLQFAEQVCGMLEFTAATDRIRRFRIRMTAPIWADVAAEFRALREALEDDIRKHSFHHYRPDKAQYLLRFGGNWEIICQRFPSIKDEALSGVDCYAFGQNTASVFHLMRVAEIGLRALARERKVRFKKNKPLEWATWQDILSKIKASADKIANQRAGPARDAALQFYRGALSEFEGFKDAYRNDCMHARKSYNEHEALAIMTHVRNFMDRLSQKLDESATRIKWGVLS